MKRKDELYELFKKGIAELNLFFPTFKPNTAQIRAWYHRLKPLEEEQLRLTIYTITESQAKTPTFYALKWHLFEAKNILKKIKAKTIIIEGGYAPMSNEKHALVKECIRGNWQMFALSKPERAEQARFLKEVWRKNYPKLPGYKTEAQCKELLRQKNWAELIRLGVIAHEPTKPDVYYPGFFEVERENTRDVEADYAVLK
jgi:hypothetical protein